MTTVPATKPGRPIRRPKAVRDVAIMDIEVYPNFYLIAFLSLANGQTRYFEHPLDDDKLLDLKEIFDVYRIVTFNGTTYDMPMVHYIMKKHPCDKVKEASDTLIHHDLKPWVFSQQFGVEVPRTIEHVDLFDIPRGKAGLKTYAGRMHSKIIQELPFPIDTVLTEAQKQIVRDYCRNDLNITHDLYKALKEQIDLRDEMTKQYGLDLRSKSDAQIAEAVMKSEIYKKSQYVVQPKKRSDEYTFAYTAPDWMPKTDTVKAVEATKFQVRHDGSIVLPDHLKGRIIGINQKTYRLGVGGLHSDENCMSYYSDNEWVIVDRDVASYYPAIALNLGLHPEHVSKEDFVDTYRSLVARRLEAKRNKQKVIADSLKICVNGLFGKTGNPYSPFYAPQMMVAITLTGQLSLLMLIDMLAKHKDIIEVISANTDGVTVRVKRFYRSLFEETVKEWETQTGFVTEETEYNSIHIRDVNNYVALKKDGCSVKVKGIFNESHTLEKNPTNLICSEAMIRYLMFDVPPEVCIRECRDIRSFVSVRKVQGGAIYKGQEIGSVIRWYYCNDPAGDHLIYKNSRNAVPRTMGAKPLPILPEAGTLPDDIDYDWYIQETKNMLKEVGVICK